MPEYPDPLETSTADRWNLTKFVARPEDSFSELTYPACAAYFPKSHGRQRVDDRRVLSGIIFVNRNGLRWRDAPKEYGPSKTLYNRWKRWGDKGIFLQMMEGLAVPDAADRKTIMIDATYLKAHRTASSLRVKKGARAA